MFREVFNFYISGIGKCIQLTKNFILDDSGGITLFHFLLFVMFIRIIIFVLEYMKKIEIVVGENEKEYKKEKRLKK